MELMSFRAASLDWPALRKKTQLQLKSWQRSVGRDLQRVALDLSSFVVHAFAATTGYTLGLLAAQSIGYCCRVSCATPILGSLLGGMGVAAASVTAGQFSKCTHLLQAYGPNAVSHPAFREFRSEHVLADIIIGLSFYKFLGGRFCNVMPSDLFHPGAYAAQSLPARVSIHATPNERIEIGELFKQYGCHSCGTRSGKFIADHIPPSKFALLADPMTFADRLGFGKQARMAAALFDVSFQPPAQRFYPQCSSCSSRQGIAVRNNKRALMFHFGGPRPYHAAGVFVGLHERATRREEHS